MKKIITKARNDENTKEKKNFVLSKFRAFVINPFGFRLPHSFFHLPSFRLPHSPFHIPHSAFRIPPSTFRIPISAFLLPPSFFPHSAFQLPHSLTGFPRLLYRLKKFKNLLDGPLRILDGRHMADTVHNHMPDIRNFFSHYFTGP